MKLYIATSTCLFAAAAALAVQAQTPNVNSDGGGLRYLEPGQPPVIIHPTVDMARQARARQAQQYSTPQSGTKSLYYHGGIGGIAVERAPKVYLVLWGSQWINNDPSGEAKLLENFYNGVGGSKWNNSVTQYCQGVAKGTYFCGNRGVHAGNPPGIFAGVWADSIHAPDHPTQSQFAAEAVSAARHFGNAGSMNKHVQYVIATSHGHNASGFATKYCAWHSWASSADGNIAYTNLPYITDGGATCGANFNGLGPKAGITMVSGHEMAETETDQYPNGGWLDSAAEENGDKCAWISSGHHGASARVMFPNGSSFPLQSLWSNAYNRRAGGCVLSY